MTCKRVSCPSRSIPCSPTSSNRPNCKSLRDTDHSISLQRSVCTFGFDLDHRHCRRSRSVSRALHFHWIRTRIPRNDRLPCYRDNCGKHPTRGRTLRNVRYNCTARTNPSRDRSRCACNLERSLRTTALGSRADTDIVPLRWHARTSRWNADWLYLNWLERGPLRRWSWCTWLWWRCPTHRLMSSANAHDWCDCRRCVAIRLRQLAQRMAANRSATLHRGDNARLWYRSSCEWQRLERCCAT